MTSIDENEFSILSELQIMHVEFIAEIEKSTRQNIEIVKKFNTRELKNIVDAKQVVNNVEAIENVDAIEIVDSIESVDAIENVNVTSAVIDLKTIKNDDRKKIVSTDENAQIERGVEDEKIIKNVTNVKMKKKRKKSKKKKKIDIYERLLSSVILLTRSRM